MRHHLRHAGAGLGALGMLVLSIALASSGRGPSAPASAHPSADADAHMGMLAMSPPPTPAAQPTSPGIPIYPEKVQLPDGGLVYRYALPGGNVMEVPVPPPTFTPLSAPAAELKRYGFPPRPSGADELAEWIGLMSGYRYSDMLPDDPLIYPDDDTPHYGSSPDDAVAPGPFAPVRTERARLG